MFNLFRNIGAPEVVIIAILVFFFFGGRKLGEFAQGMRKSREEFKKIKEDLENPDDKEESDQ